MPIYKDLDTGHILVEDYNENLIWSSDRPPINLLPESSWITTQQTISFPDFSKFVNYAYQRVSAASGNPPPWALSGSGDACQTVTMIDPLQEWNGPEISIGTVPANANYIDVRVNLNQIKASNAFLDQSVQPLIATNQWVHLPGGSGLIEATNVWRRLFTVALNGTSVVLRRKQTTAAIPANAVARYGGIYENSAANGDAFITSNRAGWGWMNSGGGGWVGNYRAGHPAALIQVGQFGQNPGASVPTSGAKHPTRERRCSTNAGVHDFSSTYAGTIVIRPGYIKT